MTELVRPDAEEFAAAHTSGFGGQLAAVAGWTQDNTSSPQMMSGLAEARLLELLTVVSGARRVLEIGTFTGLGTLTVAAALPTGGRIITLEADEQIAAVARDHFSASEHSEKIELVVGDALESLSAIEGPFDLVYIDASKQQYPDYFEAVLPKLAGSGVIVADNLFRGGATLDDSAQDDGTNGMREFARRANEDERVHNVLLTIGDGVMLVWHRPA